MASLDLSMAFDLVNIELLIKKLQIMGFIADWQHSEVKGHEPRLYSRLGCATDLTDLPDLMCCVKVIECGLPILLS